MYFLHGFTASPAVPGAYTCSQFRYRVVWSLEFFIGVFDEPLLMKIGKAKLMQGRNLTSLNRSIAPKNSDYNW